MDTARSNFYWQGLSDKKKYHMIKWEALCRPKNYGGMGFLDTRIMNICLLSKWIIKLENGYADKCITQLPYHHLKNAKLTCIVSHLDLNFLFDEHFSF